jgi:hypothetical protein
MLTKYLAAAVIGSALMATPVLAQTNAASSGNASSSGLWQASKLVKMNVYNQQNEKIGSIQELMVDKGGKIDSVVIGVGGFLGMGEHDVAVKFADLKWSDQPVRSTSSSATPPSTTGADTSTRTNGTYPDHAVLANATKDQLKAMPQFQYNK